MGSKSTAILIPILSLLFSACLWEKNDAADRQAIKATVEEYGRAVNARNSDTAVTMMTERTYYAAENHPALVGKQAIRKMLQSTFDRFGPFDLEFKAPVGDVEVSGALGTARGTWVLKATDKSGMLAPLNESGNWAVICRRQSDHSWTWDSVIVNSDQPPSGVTAEDNDEEALIRIEKDMPAVMAKANQALGDLKGSYKIQSVALSDLQPRVLGDFATFTMAGKIQGSYRGIDEPGTLQFSEFFVRRDGKWQVVCSQNRLHFPSLPESRNH
jgi:ketosteroid isomerase-like protein